MSSLEHLWAPWRFSYVQNATKMAAAGCLFCALGASDDARRDYVLHVAPSLLVVLNLYPYATGHVMVAPRAHWASPTEAPLEEHHRFAEAVVYVERVLRAVYRPDGLNIGMNLGAAAGAGVPGHFHAHLVPRWSGDTNFMTTVGDTRVHPESLQSVMDKLLPYFEHGLLAADHPLFKR